MDFGDIESGAVQPASKKEVAGETDTEVPHSSPCYMLWMSFLNPTSRLESLEVFIDTSDPEAALHSCAAFLITLRIWAKRIGNIAYGHHDMGPWNTCLMLSGFVELWVCGGARCHCGAWKKQYFTSVPGTVVHQSAFHHGPPGQTLNVKTDSMSRSCLAGGLASKTLES
eukprot:3542575-Amphidinium_carterae.1